MPAVGHSGPRQPVLGIMCAALTRLTGETARNLLLAAPHLASRCQQWLALVQYSSKVKVLQCDVDPLLLQLLQLLLLLGICVLRTGCSQILNTVVWEGLC